jgi:transcriptional regulator with XRE-family HTH domain
MAHPLRVYLTKHGLTVPALAEIMARHGYETSCNYISQILGGHRRPGGALACALSDATNKHVSVEDMLRYEREAKTSPKRRKRAA